MRFTGCAVVETDRSQLKNGPESLKQTWGKVSFRPDRQKPMRHFVQAGQADTPAFGPAHFVARPRLKICNQQRGYQERRQSNRVGRVGDLPLQYRRNKEVIETTRGDQG